MPPVLPTRDDILDALKAAVPGDNAGAIIDGNHLDGLADALVGVGREVAQMPERADQDVTALLMCVAPAVALRLTRQALDAMG